MSNKLIKCGNFIDERGILNFCNDFDFTKIKRFYTVQNFKKNFIRAWHGHKKEEKYVYVVSGIALIALIKIDDWNNPSKDLKIEKYFMDSNKPSILHIPEGYVNGSMNLNDDTIIQYFSSTTLEESKNDDYRFQWDYWENVWNVEYR